MARIVFRGHSELNAVSAAREIMTTAEMARAFKRMAHEIIERNKGAKDLVLAGIPTRGVHLASRLASLVDQFEAETPTSATLDPTDFRDDTKAYARGQTAGEGEKQVIEGADVDGMCVVIVDDVFNTGRTARAAMDALMHAGRPARVQLAVLVNRGHRELPISPDFVGKHIPTARSERVNVMLTEVDGWDGVSLVRPSDSSEGRQ